MYHLGELAKKLCHCCYRQEWHFKSGGCLGISHLCSKLPVSWVIIHEVSFVKALLYVLKDLLPEVSLVTVEEASDTLKFILNTCNSNPAPNQVRQIVPVYF